MHKFLARHPELEQFFIHIAQGRVFLRPAVVQTVLGSCVSVTFHCPQRKIGAIFHALLPRAKEYAGKEHLSEPYRFVDTAILTLWDELKRIGVDKNMVLCKIFGGGNTMLDGELAVGKKNALAAFETLAQLGLRVIASNVGGEIGRKLFFLPHTGDVFVKSLSPSVGK